MFKVKWDFQTTTQIESRSQDTTTITWENYQIWVNKLEPIEPTVNKKLEFLVKLSRQKNWPNTWSLNPGIKEKDGNLMVLEDMYIFV